MWCPGTALQGQPFKASAIQDIAWFYTTYVRRPYLNENVSDISQPSIHRNRAVADNRPANISGIRPVIEACATSSRQGHAVIPAQNRFHTCIALGCSNDPNRCVGLIFIVLEEIIDRDRKCLTLLIGVEGSCGTIADQIINSGQSLSTRGTPMICVVSTARCAMLG